jgi:hypothetical protein
LDPTGHDALYRWLAYGHPAWMLIAIALAGLALRAGIGLRRARLARLPRAADARARHARLGKVAVTLILLGFLGGPLSMWLLRGRVPYETAHAFLATLGAALFASVAILGRRLERGRAGRGSRRMIDAHATLALLATLAAAVAFATGFVLLP